MQEQQLNTQAEAQTQATAPTPQRTWERPTLQRLHISLDTAGSKGSNTDGIGGSLK